MAEEEQQEKESELPLFADLDRFANLLNEAQSLAKKNSNYNPAAFRNYFVILREIQRFLLPLFYTNKKMKWVREDIERLDKITMKSHRKLLGEKDYKVPAIVFEILSDLHTDLLILKQDANLGIKVRERITPRKRLENVLE